MKKIKVGLIGAGQVGNYHLNTYDKIPNAEVIGVSDIVEKKARNSAKRHKIKHVYTDYHDLLENEEVDAVDICLHNNLHSPVTIDSLESNKDVFCEKPMAGSYPDARKMYEKAKETGKTLTIQNLKLYSKETKATRNLIKEKKLGKVFYGHDVNLRRRGRPFIEGYGSPNFVRKDMSGGGAVYDMGTYSIGRMLYLLGLPEIERISGKTFQTANDMYDAESLYGERMKESGFSVEDSGFGFVKFNQDRVMSITNSWHMYSDRGRGGAVVGTRGGVRLKPFQFFTTISDMEADVTFDLEEYERRKCLLKDEEEILEKSLVSDPLYHWIRDLQGREHPRIHTDEIALKTMLIMDGIYLSDELGKEVTAKEVVEKTESTAMTP